MIYSTNFDDFVSGTHYFAGVAEYSYGHDADGTASDNNAVLDNFKPLGYGQWGRGSKLNTNFIDVGNGDIEARPNTADAKNAKLMGTFLDPALFNATGSGRYTFSVDYTGADSGASWIFLYRASNYDTSGSNTLIFDAANGGFGNFDPFTGTGTASVSEIIRKKIVDETVNETWTHTFDYTAGETIGIAFGSYETAGMYDNLKIAIVPEPETYALLLGTCLGVLVILARVRFQKS